MINGRGKASLGRLEKEQLKFFMEDWKELETPCLVLDVEKTASNIERMQAVCREHGVELRPHIKTHKMVEIAKMQLAAGAAGLTCAKISEAEALLPSGVKSIFVAHSIVDPLKGPRLKALSEKLDELYVGVTSAGQAHALEAVLAGVDLTLPVIMAINTGLLREGTRTQGEGVELANLIGEMPHLKLHGIYTHEGHAYKRADENREAVCREVLEQLLEMRKLIGNESLKIWPGCSVTGACMATLPGVDAVRPGSYVFGDLSLAVRAKTMDWDQVSLTVLATVIDMPEPGLALIDAGSKVFSSDKTPGGETAIAQDGRDIIISHLSEEHGFATGADVDGLQIGDKLTFVTAHVCPVLNLANEVVLLRDGRVDGRWAVEARGCVQ